MKSIRALLSLLTLGALIIPINLLQILSWFLVRPFSAKGFRKVNLEFAYLFWKTCVFFTEKILKIELVFSGDAVPPQENVILFCNHQQMPDILAIMPLADRCGRLANMKWFAKDAIKYVPGIGWGMLFLDCVFLKRDWSSDAHRIRKTFSKLLEHGLPFWLISFSEGTRITPPKLQRSQEFAQAHGLKVLQNVLLPRTRGFVAQVIALREKVDAVYDVTIGYEPNVPTLWQFYCGDLRKIHLHVRRFPMAEIPTDEKALADWLMNRFIEKDELMGRFHACQSFR